jgi:hypothetical protein
MIFKGCKMKKYIASILIPCVLLQFSGCYSMQKVAKNEFTPEPNYPELILKTEEKKFTFEEGNYKFEKDTIYGKGEYELLNNDYKPFEGKISVKEVEKIETEKMFSQTDTAVNIVLTKEREFIFKLNSSNYSIHNDTIFGKGNYRFRTDNDQFNGAISINDAEEIQIDEFDAATTILTGAFIVSFIAIIISAVITPMICIFCD